MVRSECIAFVNQLGTFQSANQLVIKALLFKFALNHLLTHFCNASVKRNCYANLNAPVVAALIITAD